MGLQKGFWFIIFGRKILKSSLVHIKKLLIHKLLVYIIKGKIGKPEVSLLFLVCQFHGLSLIGYDVFSLKSRRQGEI